MSQYARSLVELSSNAILHWPDYLLARQANISVLPLLLETQEKFISLLNLSEDGPESWESILANVSAINNTLFLMHLMVFSDIDVDTLNSIMPFARYFPDKVMMYGWRGQVYRYAFHTPGDVNLGDRIMLLLHGGAAYGNTLPEDVKAKCTIGSMLGKPHQIKEFIKKSYAARTFARAYFKGISG